MLGSPVRSPRGERLNSALAAALLQTLQAALVESPARAAARDRLGVPIEAMHDLVHDREQAASAQREASGR
jgi:hypothetical protein